MYSSCVPRSKCNFPQVPEWRDFKSMRRNFYVGATIVALAATLGVGSAVVAKRARVQAAGVMAPHFEVDALWPRPLPNHWVIGQTIGLDVDTHDNVWIIHRPGTFDS